MSEPKGLREKIQACPPTTLRQDREVLKLHDDAPKEVTTLHTAIIETEKVKGFHPTHWSGKMTTTVPSRGLGHPQASPPPLPES